MALSLEHAGVELQGARLLIESDIPPGAGLSSSAALEVSSALALLANAGRKMEPAEIAQVCHRAENDFIGIRSGVMDQFASWRAGKITRCCSIAGHLNASVPLPAGSQ